MRRSDSRDGWKKRGDSRAEHLEDLTFTCPRRRHLLHLHLDLPERAQLAALWADLSALYYINTFHCAILPVTHSCKHTAHERSFELLELVQQLAAHWTEDHLEFFPFAHVLAGREQRV